MDDNIEIAETHGQYYQLAMEQDRDINGNSDGQNDVVVWYCLRGDYYDKSPNDVRNNYYFYSKGNVIYTGAGHSTVNNEKEIELFINAMVAAKKCNCSSSGSGLYQFAESGKEKRNRYATI